MTTASDMRGSLAGFHRMDARALRSRPRRSPRREAWRAASEDQEACAHVDASSRKSVELIDSSPDRGPLDLLVSRYLKQTGLRSSSSGTDLERQRARTASFENGWGLRLGLAEAAVVKDVATAIYHARLFN